MGSYNELIAAGVDLVHIADAKNIDEEEANEKDALFYDERSDVRELKKQVR